MRRWLGTSRWAHAGWLAWLPLLASAATVDPRPATRAAVQVDATFRRVAFADDVPAHVCSALAQDRDGFLWVGTQGGLVRYDGYEARVFRAQPNDPHALGGSYVRALLATSDGRLWVGTFSAGVSVYDPVRETFTRYAQHPPGSSTGLSHDRVEGLAEDHDGHVWVATHEGLDRIDPRTGASERFHHVAGDARSLADDRVRGLLVDRKGRVWVGHRDGLQRWLGAGRGFERVASERTQPGSLAGQTVGKLYEDARGRLWVGTADHGLAVLDPDTGALRRLGPRPAQPDGLSHFWVYGFAEADPDTLWVATFGGGIDVIDTASLRVLARLRSDPSAEGTLPGDRVGALLRDRAGLLWVGTWGQGLARHDPGVQAFRSLRARATRPDGLSHPAAVRALEMQDGTLWVGTNGNGVDVFDRELRRRDAHRPDAHDPHALSDGAVTCLAQASDGTAYVATLDGNLHLRRPRAWGFERLTRADGLPGGPIRALTFDARGVLWIGAAEGLGRLDPGAARVQSFHHRADASETLVADTVEAIALGPQGMLWLGTDSGLDLFDPASGQVRAHVGAGRGGLPNKWVRDLWVAQDGRLWIATEAGACLLAAWDGARAQLECVSERGGLPAAPVDALIEDMLGGLWLGARQRLDPRTWQVQSFGPADGCEFRSFFIASRARLRDGRLAFGSPEGLLMVTPTALHPWNHAPPLVASALFVDGVRRAGVSRLSELLLHPGQRGFRLEAAALDFSAPERLVYRSRLEGFDADWSPAGPAQRSPSFTNLPPGAYVLRVAGTNRVGQWSPHELRLAVRVLPAWHQAAWFRGLSVVSLLAVGFAGYRLRVRGLRRRARELSRLVEQRTQALKEQGLQLAERNRDLQAAYARIEAASLTDPLTDLRNRRFLEQALPADVELALRRHEDDPRAAPVLALLLLDLDGFKAVNDTHGHAAGDLVLARLAALLRATFRAADHVVRWGGEEFLIVARFVERAQGPELAEKVRQAVAAHPFTLPDGTCLRLTVSLGQVSFPLLPRQPRALSWTDTLVLADVALYAAKRSGRNRWVALEAGAGELPSDLPKQLRGDPTGLLASRALVARTHDAAALRWS